MANIFDKIKFFKRICVSVLSDSDEHAHGIETWVSFDSFFFCKNLCVPMYYISEVSPDERRAITVAAQTYLNHLQNKWK